MVTIRQLDGSLTDTDLVYHYTSLPIALEFLLKNREIRFNSLKNTNDPLEFIQFITGLASKPDSPSDDVDRVLWEGVSLVDIVKKVCKVCCFSCDKELQERDYGGSHLFSKGYCLPRMWSQYGDDHYGVCVVFSREKLIEHIRTSGAHNLPQEGDIRIIEKEITYDNSIPGLDEAISCEYEKVKNKDAEHRLEEHLNPLLFTKFRNYEHEQEWRVVLYLQQFKNIEHLDVKIGDSIKGLILGCRFKSIYLPSIRQFTSLENIPIFQLTWFNGKPELSEVC